MAMALTLTFSELPVRQRGAITKPENHYQFLSCLCGSEDFIIIPAEEPVFLSCLCGSEGGLWLDSCLLPFL
ncbi:hypothetical protein ACTFBY_22365, partial [Aeromonas dhakensis]